ncbi:isocitrate dehydrogenase [NAD] subunit gamma, mitochondrial-like [Dermacentor albipictus]|uniref:isocitrate dehydrogenase [NAD] subunit gamma, mitochondrial-like n=1 Tax=Dermacentor albipictus TaxID=60249 RepID=UPI0031FC95F3
MAMSRLQRLRASSSWSACRRRLLAAGVDGEQRGFRSSTRFASERSYRMTKYGGRYFVTMLPGHGIGPEMMNHVETVFFHGKVPVDFEKVIVATDTEDAASMDYAIASIRRTGVAIKGNVETRSYSPSVEPRNLVLRNRLGLYVNVVHCRNHPAIKTRHPNVDVVIIRQNTEGEYSCLEHEVTQGVVESIKVITRTKSEQIARYGFEYARSRRRKKVTVVHKANIMKLSDGLFLETCRQVARDYPDIEMNDMIVDNCSMQLVSNPSQFDVVLVPNLYGNIVVNLTCGLVGGAGVTSGRNYGDEFAVFETATRNTGTPLVGKNLANPVATLYAAVDMLKHLGLMEHAYVIRDAILKTINEHKVHTRDIGGSATTIDVVDSIVEEVRKNTR